MFLFIWFSWEEFQPKQKAIYDANLHEKFQKVFNEQKLDLIEKAWSQGFVKVEEVNVATISYVAGYVQKKLYGSDIYPDCITPPFSRMSKSIGKKFFSEHCDDIWENGLHFQGYRIKVPISFKTS